MENGTLHFHGRLQDVKEFNPDLFTVWQEKIKRARFDLICSCLLSNDHVLVFYGFTSSVRLQLQTRPIISLVLITCDDSFYTKLLILDRICWIFLRM